VRICLLTPQDLEANPFPADDWPCDPRPYLPDATWDVATLEKDSSVRTIRRLAGEGYDLFFNLCDGTPECDVPGIEVRAHARETERAVHRRHLGVLRTVARDHEARVPGNWASPRRPMCWRAAKRTSSAPRRACASR